MQHVLCICERQKANKTVKVDEMRATESISTCSDGCSLGCIDGRDVGYKRKGMIEDV